MLTMTLDLRERSYSKMEAMNFCTQNFYLCSCFHCTILKQQRLRYFTYFSELHWKNMTDLNGFNLYN